MDFHRNLATIVLLFLAAFLCTARSLPVNQQRFDLVRQETASVDAGDKDLLSYTRADSFSELKPGNLDNQQRRLVIRLRKESQENCTFEQLNRIEREYVELLQTRNYLTKYIAFLENVALTVPEYIPFEIKGHVVRTQQNNLQDKLASKHKAMEKNERKIERLGNHPKMGLTHRRMHLLFTKGNCSRYSASVDAEIARLEKEVVKYQERDRNLQDMLVHGLPQVRKALDINKNGSFGDKLGTNFKNDIVAYIEWTNDLIVNQRRLLKTRYFLDLLSRNALA